MDGSPSSNAGIAQYMDELHYNSLRLICHILSIVAYLWLVYVIWPQTGGAAGPAAWTSSTVLTIVVVLGYFARNQYSRPASFALVLGLTVATLGAIIHFGAYSLIYLFIVPVCVAGVLLGPLSTILVAIISSMITAVLGSIVFRISFVAPEIMIPQMIILLVAVTSVIAVRNLHTALRWSWQSYTRSLESERTARLRGAELRQALKSLDESTYRLERMNHALRLAREQADEARRLKQRFAQAISHELRTPLNLIMGFTELMIQSPEYYGHSVAPGYTRDLGIVYRNAKHLQGLVNDVLDLARIEAEQMSLAFAETDPARLVADAVATSRSLVESKGLSMVTRISPDLPPVNCDAIRVRQVLFNLINNASRFTETGSVTVGVEAQNSRVRFWVEDTGVGIAQDDLPKLFKEFSQLESAKGIVPGGIGLGLAISKSFVELHGGDMVVQSALGRGSKFSFTLPSMDTEPGPGEMVSPRSSEALGKGGRSTNDILLAVTQSQAVADLLSRHIEGVRVVTISTIDQARRLVGDLVPQMVLVDVCSVDLNHGQFGQLSSDSHGQGIPIISCGFSGEEYLRKQMNVDGYLTKPIAKEGLWDLLRDLSDDVKRVLVVDDDHDFVRLVSRMLEDPVRQYECAGAYTGAEALEMCVRWLPDLLLLDLGLPDMDGAVLLDRVRAALPDRPMHVIVVTGHGETEGLDLLRGEVTITKSDGMTSSQMLDLIQALVNAGHSRSATDDRSADHLPEAEIHQSSVKPILSDGLTKE